MAGSRRKTARASPELKRFEHYERHFGLIREEFLRELRNHPEVVVHLERSFDRKITEDQARRRIDGLLRQRRGLRWEMRTRYLLHYARRYAEETKDTRSIPLLLILLRGDALERLSVVFKWLRGGDCYPEEVRWLKTGWNTEPTVTDQDLLTEDEIKRMVEACRETRDKAFIGLLRDSGGRIGEIRALRVGDIDFDATGAWANIPRGKTGQRRVRVVTFAAYLREWLKAHPRKDDREAPLFVAFGNAGGRRPSPTRPCARF